MACSNLSTARWASFAATAAGLALAAAQAAQAQPMPPVQSSVRIQGPGVRDPIMRGPLFSDVIGRDRRAPDERPPAQSLTIVPTVGVRVLATDNVYLTPSNHVSDIVTSPFASVTASLAGPRSNGAVSAEAGYDSYSRAHQFNGFSFTGWATGDYQIVRRFLSIEADGGVTNGNVSAFGTPAVDRTGVAGRTQLVNLAIGPRLTTTLGDLLDLQAIARLRWVGYSAGENSTTTGLPEDSTIREVSAAVTTGDRFERVEAAMSATYQADDNDFSSYGALASVYFRVSPSLRLLARGGADDIDEPGSVDIQAPVWSVGVEYEINSRSYVRLEGGRRYHEDNFAAESYVELTDRFYLTGSYSERILPPQISQNDGFLSFVNNNQTLPPPIASERFGIFGNLLNDTSKDKVGAIRAAYTWPDQEIGVGASWTGREVLATGQRDETVTTSISYMRRMRPDLTGEIALYYSKVRGGDLSGNSRRLEGSARLSYQFTPQIQITGGYAYSNDLQTGFGRERLVENVAFAGISKSF